MASCKLGHVYIVPTLLTNPPKSKFALCVCVSEGFFVWINSEARAHGKDQLPVVAGCHELMKHNSYVDLSRVVRHPGKELAQATEAALISQNLCASIVAFVDRGLQAMPPRHTEILRANLSGLYSNPSRELAFTVA